VFDASQGKLLGARSLPSGCNAPTESWFNSFKNERVHGWRFATREDMTATAFEHIEVFYNRRRLHSTLGYKSPTRFLQDGLPAQQMEIRVA